MNLQATIGYLSIKRFSNTRKDESISKGVRELHKLTGKAGIWVKNKLDPDALVEIGKIANIARDMFYTATLPWETGRRIIPHGNRAAIESSLATVRAQFNAAVERFVDAYPGHVAVARTMHNGTFKETDYPAPSEVRQEFSMTLDIFPVPSKKHFESKLQQSYGAALEAAIEDRVAEAMRDTWNRILKPIKLMAEALKSPDTRFHDTLVDNLREAAALAPSLNLTRDPQIPKAVDQIRILLSGVSPDALRENKTLRAITAKQAAGLVKQFGKFGGRALGTE